MSELTLSEIWIYPVKSLGGISLPSSRVMQKGLEFDRRWMLIDEHGTFLSQRTYPLMSLFKLSFAGQSFQVNYREHNIRIGFESYTSTDFQNAEVWDDSVNAYEVSNEHSQWFSEMLSMKCKLVFFPEKNPRPVDLVYQLNNEHVSLADAFPFLLIGQSSLDDLNEKLNESIPMNRFRPNLVFTGGKPFEEDTWKDFTIGQNEFVAVKPCARCILTTVNQDTGQRGSEPLKTLATYRKENNKILFGQNCLSLNAGEIKIGDSLIIRSYR